MLAEQAELLLETGAVDLDDVQRDVEGREAPGQRPVGHGRRGGGTVSERQIMLASQTRVIIRRTTSRVRRADNSSTPRQLNWRQSTKKTFTRERAKRTAAR